MQWKKQHWYKNLQQTNTPLSGDALFCNKLFLVELRANSKQSKSSVIWLFNTMYLQKTSYYPKTKDFLDFYLSVCFLIQIKKLVKLALHQEDVPRRTSVAITMTY